MNIDISRVGHDVRAFARQVANIRAEIDQAKQKIQAIIYAPLCKDEIFERLEAYAIKQEKIWNERANSIFEQIRLDRDVSNQSKTLHRRPFFPDPSGLNFSLPLEVQIFGIIGAENMMTVLRDRYDSIGYTDEGLHTSKRLEKIAELEQHIEKLRKKETAMIEAAASAGLNIS